MKVLVLGSKKSVSEENISEYTAFGEKMGMLLSKLSLEIILCSPFDDSLDFWVFQGIQANRNDAKAKVIIHTPKENGVLKKWHEYRNQNASMISELYEHPFEKGVDESLKYSWLYSQMIALDSSDIVVLAGGSLNGSALLLLRLAEAQKKIVIPFYQFGGIAEYYFKRNYYKLRDKWGEDRLKEMGQSEKLPIIIRSIYNSPLLIITPFAETSEPIFFISYPRSRPQEADYVEMILRRRGYVVLRDENEINESVDITNAIEESIHKATVFISLWGSDYACSPWCYDELTTAIKKKDSHNYMIWILCIDDTRMIHPQARSLVNFRVRTREEIEGRLALLLERFKS